MIFLRYPKKIIFTSFADPLTFAQHKQHRHAKQKNKFHFYRNENSIVHSLQRFTNQWVGHWNNMFSSTYGKSTLIAFSSIRAQYSPSFAKSMSNPRVACWLAVRNNRAVNWNWIPFIYIFQPWSSVHKPPPRNDCEFDPINAIRSGILFQVCFARAARRLIFAYRFE